MDLKEIQALIKFVSTNAVDEVEINRKDFKLVIKKNAVQVVAAASPAPMAMPQPMVVQTTQPAATSQAAPSAPEASAKADNLITIKSPMVGTFYRAPNPESPNFVNIGDTVKVGQTLCIIEAMKLLNEIESEHAGVIKEILCENGQGVEFDQPLFIIA
jgi:acetyl-CoA carboxylase biotin carboxyl carrier protein